MRSAPTSPRGRAKSTADEAIAGAQRVAESLTGVPGEGIPQNQKDLDDLAELHRRNAIQERLQKIKSDMKKS